MDDGAVLATLIRLLDRSSIFPRTSFLQLGHVHCHVGPCSSPLLYQLRVSGTANTTDGRVSLFVVREDLLASNL